jgi:hypothetical protein
LSVSDDCIYIVHIKTRVVLLMCRSPYVPTANGGSIAITVSGTPNIKIHKVIYTRYDETQKLDRNSYEWSWKINIVMDFSWGLKYNISATVCVISLLPIWSTINILVHLHRIAQLLFHNALFAPHCVTRYSRCFKGKKET